MVAVKKERFDYHSHRESLNSNREKQKVKSPTNPVLSTGLLVLVLVIMALTVVYRYSMIHSYNAELRDIKASYNSLVDEQNRLVIEVARLGALSRIDEIATEELELRLPSPEQIVVVETSNWGASGD